MRRLAISLSLLAASVVLLAFAANASAEDEFEKYELESTSASLSTSQAGGHPDFVTDFKLTEDAEGNPYAYTRDIQVTLPPGLFGNPQAFPTCSQLQLGTEPELSECPQDSQIGVTKISLGGGNHGSFLEPVYNMPSPGGDVVARFGFFAALYPASINIRLDPNTERLVATVESAPAAAALVGAETTFWGVPAASAHDLQRITPAEATGDGAPPSGGRKSNLPETPFMTNSTHCGEEQEVGFKLTAYQLPEAPTELDTHMAPLTGCGFLNFNPQLTSLPTTEQASTGSGLDYRLSLSEKGLEFPNLPYESEARADEVVLPEGMSVNPSEAEGLGVCSEAELARETYDSGPNVGCPETSKIGSVTSVSPAVDRIAEGSLYLAKPYENPFGSLLALYMVVKIPDRGVLVVLKGKVTPNPSTGRLTTVFEDVPQLPVSSFDLHFREGARAPLVTPPACGTYETASLLSGWSGAASLRESPFKVTSGVEHGPCPTGGLPAFKPGLIAGTLNNAAGTFSPFDVRLFRSDSEQEITHFSIKLPPGVLAKLAGIPFCPDAQIAAAKARSGPHGGEEELDSPSCPLASEVGHTLVGAGVGGVLTYVPGRLYLAGPYHGSALSIVAITAAKAGPFDLGTVVIRDALRIDPETGEAFVDATGSDPIPHIIAGIPVRLRDIRAYVDRPDFVINPTSCKRTSTASTVLGSGLDFASEADDRPVTVSTPFQVADCAALPFEPRLSLKLRGGTRRGAYPALSATLKMNGIGESGVHSAQVVLPASEFIANAHFKTICTRVQFKQGAHPGEMCPPGSVYGYAKATTPLLSEPLQGPVFLRSSEHQLPDVVAALHNGEIDITLDGRVDSVKGRLRNTFEATPDAPVSSVQFHLLGGKKGLFENSTDLCASTHRAEANFSGQNGKVWDKRPLVQALGCRGKKRKASKRH